MDNSKMVAGRFLKRQQGKNLFSDIIKHLESKGTVYICTHMRILKLSQKHKEMVRLGKSGSVYINKDCIDYCTVKFG